MSNDMVFFVSTVFRPTEDEALKNIIRKLHRKEFRSISIQHILPIPQEYIPARQCKSFWQQVALVRERLQNRAYWRKTRRGWREYREPRAIAEAMVLDGHCWIHWRHVEEALNNVRVQ